MLRVGCTLDQLEGIVGQLSAKFPFDQIEVGDDSVMHEQPSSKLERVIVVPGDRSLATGSSDVSEYT